ncbi:hypothetical protein [Streptomyces sp. NPDC059076]|uniref:hypothetical protein n=1 Tax=unclassified Streptomyces TaxID=2593676 RepID=UPI0036807F51
MTIPTQTTQRTVDRIGPGVLARALGHHVHAPHAQGHHRSGPHGVEEMPVRYRALPTVVCAALRI